MDTGIGSPMQVRCCVVPRCRHRIQVQRDVAMLVVLLFYVVTQHRTELQVQIARLLRTIRVVAQRCSVGASADELGRSPLSAQSAGSMLSLVQCDVSIPTAGARRVFHSMVGARRIFHALSRRVFLRVQSVSSRCNPERFERCFQSA
jgi:hypothetical protein